MGIAVLVLVMLSILLAVCSGVWVAIALVRAIGGRQSGAAMGNGAKQES